MRNKAFCIFFFFLSPGNKDYCHCPEKVLHVLYEHAKFIGILCTHSHDLVLNNIAGGNITDLHNPRLIFCALSQITPEFPYSLDKRYKPKKAQFCVA